MPLRRGGALQHVAPRPLIRLRLEARLRVVPRLLTLLRAAVLRRLTARHAVAEACRAAAAGVYRVAVHRAAVAVAAAE